MENAAIELMERMPVSKAIVKLALPTMLGMVVQSIYNVTDTFFIGMTGDPDLVAGISLAFPLFMLTQGIGSLFGVGSASYISRKLGEKDYAEAKRTSSVTFYTTFLIGGAMSLAMLLLKDDILTRIGTSENTYGPTDDYFTVICLFAIVMIQNISMQGIVRSEGAAMPAMIGMVSGIFINIALDPLFIIYFGWGVKGAAWATIIGAAFSCLYFVRFMVSKKTMLSLSPRDMKPNRRMFAEILKIGLPMGVMHIVMSASGMISNVFAAGYGDFVVAAQGINMRVHSLAFSSVAGLAMGFQPFAGYNYGAKNYARLWKGLKATIIYSTSLSVIFLIVLSLFSRDIISLFIDDTQTIDAGARLLRAFALGAPFMGVQMTLMTTFQALGLPFRSLIITMGRQCAVYLPLLFLLNRHFGFDGFVYTQPIADMTTCFIAIVLAVSLFKHLKKMEVEN